MSNKFDTFIKSQSHNTSTESSTHLTIEQEKELWINKLAELYSLVNKSLEDYVNSGDVRITRSPVTLHEEQIGSYRVDQLEILIGRQVVRLKPIGTFLIGARGRVDMVGPRGSVRFVIVPPASQKPTIEITISTVGEVTKPKPEPKHVPPEEWVWKISTLPPRIMYVDLNSESFQDALIGVVNGDS
ncbi:hypothetical protein [Alcaligenes faecalis]|uniref:Uncharacterized protein n=1 Tax=Alcaligenes faecalis TaxID=511 RepID=A0A2U2BGC5_ALCFA|nr:hypothetical protein [Alcaligenes faecalis]PWE13036.1 hypothetical protein DF183_14470 [Alcaligenes faecalis]